MKESNIINVHTHLDDYHHEGVTVETMIERLRADMKKNTISKAAIMAGCYMDDLYPGREEIFQAVLGMEDLVVIAGYSIFKDGQKELDQIEEQIKSGLVRGIKFFCGYEYFYPYDNQTEPVYALCKKYSIPLFVHCGITMFPTAKLAYAHPLHIDRAAVEHPDVSIVICHLGYPWLRDAAEVVRKNANVYADISGMTDVPDDSAFGKLLIRDLNELHVYMDNNFGKLLFGTDWPLFETQWYLNIVEKLNITTEERSAILHGNAEKLLKLK